MKKLIITEQQYQLILNYQDKQQLNEGWKEIVLGTAMLLGVNLSGQNKLIAQDAIKNQQILTQIKNTLESDKIEDLSQSLEDAGLRNALDKIENNAKTIEDKFNKIAKDKGLDYKLSIKTVESEKELKTKLQQGYALKDIKTKKDTIDNIEVDTLITMDLSFGSDLFFITGGYELSDIGKQAIQDTINIIKNKDINITNVIVESSTDTEPIKIGNQKLSQLRTDNVKSILNNLGIDSVTTNPLYNQGEQLYHQGMSKEQRIEARKQTSKYRYVKITIQGEKVFKLTDIKDKTVLEKNTYELVKIIEKDLTQRTTIKLRLNLKSFKCHKIKRGNKVDSCPIWK